MPVQTTISDTARTVPSLRLKRRRSISTLRRSRKSVMATVLMLHVSIVLLSGGLSFWPEGVDENDGFKVYTTKAYCGDWKKLQPGDILITLGNRRHVSVVVSTRTNKITGADPKPKSTYKVGEKYTVLEDRRVHVGAAKAYYGKLTKDLSAKAKKLVAPDSEYAMIPAGKTVTCLEARRNWIRTAAGWIEGKEEEETYLTPVSQDSAPVS